MICVVMLSQSKTSMYSAHRLASPLAWLCSEGPYQQYTAAMSKLRPGLTHPDPGNVEAPLSMRQPAATLLKVNDAKSIQRFFDLEAGQDIASLRRQLQHHAEGTRNIWLIEGINPEIVATLGNHFRMDPSFFLDYERTSKWRRKPDEPNLLPFLPSTRDSQRLFCLPYYEVQELGPPFEGHSVGCADTGRYVARNKWDGSFVGTCIVDRRCCFWSRETANGGWDSESNSVTIL